MTGRRRFSHSHQPLSSGSIDEKNCIGLVNFNEPVRRCKRDSTDQSFMHQEIELATEPIERPSLHEARFVLSFRQPALGSFRVSMASRACYRWNLLFSHRHWVGLAASCLERLGRSSRFAVRSRWVVACSRIRCVAGNAPRPLPGSHASRCR